MEGSSASSSSCTLIYVGGTASVSCVDSTSSGYKVILLQDNDPYNLTAVNVIPGEKQTVRVEAGGRYCIMELPLEDDFDSGVKYSKEFIAEEASRLTFILACIFSIILVIIIIIGKLYSSSHEHSYIYVSN